MSPEILLMVVPRSTYASLARRPGRMTPVTALRRPLLAAIVLGGSIAMGTTGHVTPALLLSTTLCWASVVVLQVAIALPLIAGPARRTVGLVRALDLYFAAHAPWSLWMLAGVLWAASPLGRPFTPILVAAAIPVILTPRIISAFFREVLELDPREAIARTLIQQAMTWASVLILFGAAVALIPRILEWFA